MVPIELPKFKLTLAKMTFLLKSHCVPLNLHPLSHQLTWYLLIYTPLFNNSHGTYKFTPPFSTTHMVPINNKFTLPFSPTHTVPINLHPLSLHLTLIQGLSWIHSFQNLLHKSLKNIFTLNLMLCLYL